MAEKVGVMIVGLAGSIGGTIVAGVELMRRKIAPTIGILTETEKMPLDGRFANGTDSRQPLIRDALGLASLESLSFSGWDVQTGSIRSSIRRNAVVPKPFRRAVRDYTSKLSPRPAVTRRDGLVQVGGENLASLRKAADIIRADIAAFRAQEKLDQIVLLNLMPTMPPVPDDPVLRELSKFEAALDGYHATIDPGMLYFYAACKEDCAFINFTPNALEVEALQELARECKIPYAGRDGKTGQTMIKTVLAPAFRARQLQVSGWFSTNILGNGDGRALADPQTCETKLRSKGSVLDEILGYPVTMPNGEPTHVVTIHYYPVRGDAKEAWDNIDLVGFLGARMQMKLNFLCKDSILAAPLLIDLARFAAHAHEHGEYGFMRYLSMYFKSPLREDGAPVVHHFFEQERMLIRYLDQCAKANDEKSGR